MTDAAQRTINGVLAVGKDGEWHLKCPACMKAPCGCADARPMTVAEAARRLIDEINRPATHEEKPDWRYLSRLDMTSLRALSEGGE